MLPTGAKASPRLLIYSARQHPINPGFGPTNAPEPEDKRTHAQPAGNHGTRAALTKSHFAFQIDYDLTKSKTSNRKQWKSPFSGSYSRLQSESWPPIGGVRVLAGFCFRSCCHHCSGSFSCWRSVGRTKQLHLTNRRPRHTFDAQTAKSWSAEMRESANTAGVRWYLNSPTPARHEVTRMLKAGCGRSATTLLPLSAKGRLSGFLP
jgi:hypothetical protein